MPPKESDKSQATDQSSVGKADIGVLDDRQTDKAVEDIVAHEGDTLLEIEDSKIRRSAPVSKKNFKAKMRELVTSKKFWLVVAVFVLLVSAIPQVRYPILGIFVKKNVAVSVIDSKTSAAVSNVEVVINGTHVKTDADGRAVVRSGIGKHSISASKQYYAATEQPYFVGFKSDNQVRLKLVATGRLVPVVVRNKISGKAIVGAQITVLGTTAKTNSKGQADIALPAKAQKYAARITLTGYNTLTADIVLTDKVLSQNNFALTPSGHIYFLSNANGNLDVVKSNLDGSGRKTILEGTGKEDPSTTSLLASRDWRYVVLKSRRDTAKPALYVIDTVTDKTTDFDTSSSEFNLIGWYGHSFIYQLNRTAQNSWQPGSQAVKSYDAEHEQLNQLDQNQAEGSSGSYAYQDFSNFYLVNNMLVYNTRWYTNGTPYDITQKQDTIRGVEPGGQNKKDYQSFASTTVASIQASLYEPQSIYYAVYDSAQPKQTYYEYENRNVKPLDLDSSDFNKTYPTYLLSPSGSQTLWSELRDGKNTLFTGTATAANKKQLASFGDYAPYGWYGDDYLLVSKNGSQLYIVPAVGLKSGEQPLKITDYYKPAQSYPGYGYGYGGL